MEASVVHCIFKPRRYFLGPNFYIPSRFLPPPFFQQRRASQMAHYSNSFTSPYGFNGETFKGHILLARSLLNGKNILPHPGYHILIIILSRSLGISLESSSVLLLSTCMVLISFMIYMILKESVKGKFDENVFLFMTFALMVVTAIYVPFFNKSVYLGQGSPNLINVPTIIVVKPFAFFCLIFFVRFLENSGQKSCKWYFLISFCLLLSALMKPSFILSFVPAAFVFIVFKYFKQFHLYWKTLILFLPVLILLGFQYLMIYRF